jgi:hypothetical protein
VFVILVNINRKGQTASRPDQVKAAAEGDWVAADDTLDQYGDVLVAVRRNRVLGAYDILSWERTQHGKARFELRESEAFASLVGEESPVRWRRGQANPVAYIDTGTVDPAAATQAVTSTSTKKPRRGMHRIVIETKGLSDTDAARLHYALVTMAKSTGRLHDFRTTSLVREMKQAAEDLGLTYRSAPSPKKQPD